MYSVYQHWDPLKVCAVGRSYPPEFYSFIKNKRLRDLFEKIAIETEEDFQRIISTLKKFNVEVVRSNVPQIETEVLVTSNQRIPGPISMNPRDQMIMVGNKFFVFPYDHISVKASGRAIEFANWDEQTFWCFRGESWPENFMPFEQLPVWAQEECTQKLNFKYQKGVTHQEFIKVTSDFKWWHPITKYVQKNGNTIVENQYHTLLNQIPANGITRVGRDLYFGVTDDVVTNTILPILVNEFFSDYRCHFITTGGHIDGCFTPVKPGLIVSIKEIKNYEKTFPGWEVIYLPGESWDKVRPFLDLKKQNQGRWWIKGHEYDQELIDYVETWLHDWTGYVEESVFDVNILVIDQQNIIVNGYNKTAFDAFDRYGITPHICPMRHRYFWDGGIHCVTLDLDREGTMQDYFPERG
jgi:hypothetical protein